MAHQMNVMDSTLRALRNVVEGFLALDDALDAIALLADIAQHDPHPVLAGYHVTGLWDLVNERSAALVRDLERIAAAVLGPPAAPREEWATCAERIAELRARRAAFMEWFDRALAHLAEAVRRAQQQLRDTPPERS
jgi:hypothetical protein